ncbi:hypothetical protein RR48_15248 [Papilio machaon]|uniref:G-protein coupled receptors family 1 profile domain-containing protein n=1 Tax=Papilio machaon TaxID=76193 RepID=A0A194QUG3_PAPMA|nr:hypothetical protein RR48_15248 [Papilio machaon]
MEGYNRTYSPIALSQEWSRVSRLMFVFILCVFGTIMNGFFIASFFVENKLSKKGNVFLALVGVADFMITAGVMPVSVVVLVSGQYDNPDVCHALQFITEVSTYTFTMFFMLSAIENYCQMGCSSAHTRKFVNLAVNPGILLVYGASISASAYGVYNGYDYDYCQRLHHGSYYSRNRRAAKAAATNTGVNVMAQDLSSDRSVSPPRENLEL